MTPDLPRKVEELRAERDEAIRLLRLIIEYAHLWDEYGCTCSDDPDATCPVRAHGYAQEDAMRFLSRFPALAPEEG